MTTASDHELVQSLPKGTRVENIESSVGTRMVTVLIPPRSARPIHLVSRQNGSGPFMDYRGASESPKISLIFFASSIPWQNGDSLNKEMPPAKILQGPRVPPLPSTASQPYPEVVGNYANLPSVRRSPAFGPQRQPLIRVGIITSGTAAAEGNRAPPVRNACGSPQRRVVPETWAQPRESRVLGERSADLQDRYHIAPMEPIRWRALRLDYPSSPLSYCSADRFRSGRPSWSERINALTQREKELLADQECLWEIDSPCSSPRRLVHRTEPVSCQHQRDSLKAGGESRPAR